MYIYLANELSMYLLWSRIRNILFGGMGMLFLFLAFSYSDKIMVGFSEFSFLSGTNEVDTLNFEITWGETTGFSVVIYNKEATGMVYKLWFVDAWITNDSFAQKACLSTNETGSFWRYVSGDTSLFALPAWGSGMKTLSVQFPPYYSWVYHGCIMFYPSTIDGSTDMNTLPRRGGFIDVLVHPGTYPVIVKAFPSNRVYQDTNESNTWILKIYNSSKVLISTSQLFTLNSAWTGEAFIDAPVGNYYVVFKWQSQLASYLSGMIIGGTGNDFFDFTTGSSLYNTQQLNDSENDGKRYQTAWDLKNTQWVYDFQINGNDIAILTINGFQEWGIGVLDPRNLNGDIAVNASDISVIGVNFAKTDPYFENSIFTW